MTLVRSGRVLAEGAVRANKFINQDKELTRLMVNGSYYFELIDTDVNGQTYARIYFQQADSDLSNYICIDNEQFDKYFTVLSSNTFL